MATVQLLYTQKDLTIKQILKYDKEKKNIFKTGMTIPFIPKKAIKIIENILFNEFEEQYSKRNSKKRRNPQK